MTAFKTVRSREIIMGKLSHGSDLLAELTGICTQKNITLGRIEALGAVRKARLGFYNQETRQYEFHELDQALEIVQLVANVSLKAGKPFVHAHVTLSDSNGAAYGGHLAPGTLVFACEFVIEAFDGPNFERNHDEETGLPLWTLEQTE